MVQALERLAQPGDCLPIHAGPVVPDGDAAMACALLQQALHRGGVCLICARSVLDGVADQVDGRAVEHARIAQHGAFLFGQVELQLHVGRRGLGPAAFHGLVQHQAQVQPLPAQRLLLGACQVHEIVGQLQGGLGIAFDARQQEAEVGRLYGAALHLQQGDDGCHGRTDVVRDELHGLVALGLGAAQIADIDQGDQPARGRRCLEGLGQQHQAASHGVAPLAAGRQAVGGKCLGREQGLAGGCAGCRVQCPQAIEQPGQGIAGPEVMPQAARIGVGCGIGQQHMALPVADKGRRGQLAQAFADEMVQGAQLARSLLHGRDALVQQVAAQAQRGGQALPLQVAQLQRQKARGGAQAQPAP